MLDNTFVVETPELVEVRFDLAGVGTRFCAYTLDVLLIGAILSIVVSMLICSGNLAWSSGEDNSWAIAIGVVLSYLVQFGYSLACELGMNGQTPGKRTMMIRVIRDDGTPATALDIVTRNLMRIIDSIPLVYVVGGVSALVHPQHKRIGDIAAGTIVIKESEADYRARTDSKLGSSHDDAIVSNAALTRDEQRVVRGFLQRRDELTERARSRLATDLMNRLYPKYGGAMGAPEEYLERLAEGRQHDS